MVTTSQINTLKAYDAIAPLYVEYSSKYQNYLNAVDRLVIERLRPGARLLDVGSGDGRRLKKIAASHGLATVISVEPSGEMAARCRATTGFQVHQLFGDELDRLPDSGFDAITALWNVLGHMASFEVRLRTLRQIRAKLNAGGCIMLDVNNRHNQLAYGRLKVLGRRVIDALAFDEKRGDAHYEWKIGAKSYPASGHLFTPEEMARLFRQADLKVAERYSVNYNSGEVSTRPFDGQLFFRLELD